MSKFAPKYKLIDEKTGDTIAIGSKRKTFRGEEVVVTGFAGPRHGGSSGRVYIDENGRTGEFYPNVVGCKLVLTEAVVVYLNKDGREIIERIENAGHTDHAIDDALAKHPGASLHDWRLASEPVESVAAPAGCYEDE